MKKLRASKKTLKLFPRLIAEKMAEITKGRAVQFTYEAVQPTHKFFAHESFWMWVLPAGGTNLIRLEIPSQELVDAGNVHRFAWINGAAVLPAGTWVLTQRLFLGHYSYEVFQVLHPLTDKALDTMAVSLQTPKEYQGDKLQLVYDVVARRWSPVVGVSSDILPDAITVYWVPGLSRYVTIPEGGK